MKLVGKIIEATRNIFNGKVRITLEIDEEIADILEHLYKLKEENLSIEIKKYREKRSLDANAYCWVLIQKLAEVLKKNKDEVYEDMICKYGAFTHYIVKPSAVEKTKEVLIYLSLPFLDAPNEERFNLLTFSKRRRNGNQT